MDTTAEAPNGRGWQPLFLAWLIALAATLGALFVGEIMGQTPCVLCWYQRVFMFPLAIILAVSAFRTDRDVWRYALPLSVGGLLVAGYHVLLYYGFVAEALTPCSKSGPSCSDAKMTIFGAIPLPVLSVLAFAGIAVLLLFARRKSSR